MFFSNINSPIEINDELTTNLNMYSLFEATDKKSQRNCNSEDVNTSPSKAGWRRAMRETPSFIENKPNENLPKQIENAINNRQYEDALKLIDMLKESVDPKVFNIFGNLLKSDCLKLLNRPEEALFCREKSVQEIEFEANRFKIRCKEEINRLHKEGLFPKSREEMDHTMHWLDEFFDRDVQLTHTDILGRTDYPRTYTNPIVNLKRLIEESIDSILAFSVEEMDPQDTKPYVLAHYSSLWSERLRWEVCVYLPKEDNGPNFYIK